ncbi:MAG: hypothetical protein WAL04_15830, partial [Acidimicrobiales bacterium]
VWEQGSGLERFEWANLLRRQTETRRPGQRRHTVRRPSPSSSTLQARGSPAGRPSGSAPAELATATASAGVGSETRRLVGY